MQQQDPVKRLMEQLSQLPGIGERTSLRLVLHMLSSARESMYTLAQTLTEVADRVKECMTCAMLTTEENGCSICSSLSRDRTILCVVASIQDLMAIETTAEFRGVYHVLHGTLAPMDGIGPQDLRIPSLLTRLSNKAEAVREIILATPPTVEGEATALYLAEQMKGFGIPISRIASGVPVGGDLQYADRLTLSRSMQLRRGF